MKTFLLIIAALLTQYTFATTYYFSSSIGDDSRSSGQAQSPATPWKTISKLNSFASSFEAGDVILLKRGDTFYGSIKLTKSGSATNPITISAFGTGAKPVISGLTTLSNWTATGNGIWESYDPLLGASVNTLLINGVAQQIGRYPNSNAANKGYLTFEAHTNTSITDYELSPVTNWVGAEVVIRKVYWIMDKNLITSHSGNTLTYKSGSGYIPWEDNSGYFIQNDIKTLDQFGEWYYNPTNKKMYVYFGNSLPVNSIVEASSINNLVANAWSVGGYSFDNLVFKGANTNAIQIVSGDNISIKDCEILFSGEDGIKNLTTKNFKLENSRVIYSANSAVSLEYDNNNAIIRNNKIENTHLFAGMGKCGDGQGIGLMVVGDGNLIEYNEVLNTGYSGIFFSGNTATVKNNFVNNYCLNKDDGAGIYTNIEIGQPSFTGRKVTGNVVLNGIGTPEGLASGVPHAHGIYLDGLTTGLEVSGNTVANNSSSGIFSVNPRDVNIYNNTVYNNKVQFLFNRSKNFPVTNNIVTDNNFFSKLPTQMVSSLNTIADDIKSFGNFDNNCYARPFDDNVTIHNKYVNASGTVKEVYDLETWKGKYSKDFSSNRSPVQYPEFIVNSLIGISSVANGAFNNNINDAGGWSALNNMVTSFATGILDGGCLEVSFQEAVGTPGSSLVTMNVGALRAGRKYLLKFSLKGSNSNLSLGVYLRKNGGTYSPITATQYSKIASIRTENGLLFSVPENVGDAAVVFTLDNQNVKFWLDNIQFNEADVRTPNPDDYIRFEYNATSNTKTIYLDDNYVDVKNKTYSNTLTLQPFSSIILLKCVQTSPVNKENQSLSFASISSKTVVDAPFTISASASSGLPVSFRIVSGPATLSVNTVTLTGIGTVIIEASQGGNNSFNAAPVVTQSFLVTPQGDNTPPVIIPRNITINASNGVAIIQPSDIIQSISDNSGVDNSSISISQSEFACSSQGSTGTSTHQAYIATTKTGTQNFGGELGMEFKVNNASGITINQLGAFDHQGNGITGTQSGGIRVAIFNKATKTIVAGLDAIISGNADAYSGNHRMKNIPAVTLMPGDYVVVSKGYNQNELNGNSEGGTPFAMGDAANGAISFATACMYGSVSAGFNYPGTPDGGPGNRYLAGTFSYTTINSGSTGTSTHQAYIATTKTGTQNFGGELGMEFKVNNASGITINQLGAFDHQGNGITGTQSGGIRVAIFNKATKTIVAGLDAIISGNADAYSGNHRMKNIPAVTLMPGDYVVVSKGYNQNELNGNSEGGTPFAMGDAANGAISFATACMYGSVSAGFNYPGTPDGGPGNRYLAGTFSYTTINSGSTVTSTHQAYIATTKTGTQNFGGELGMEFKVNNASGITINQLGAFDHQGNGITGTQSGGIRVAIFNKATKTIVAGLDAIISGNADAYSGNHRMKNIPAVTLMPGDYVVVSKGYNQNELNGNSEGGTPFAMGDAANGAISFATACMYGSVSAGFNYPGTPDGGPGNRYLAGTFSYSVVKSSTTNTNNSSIVTITAKDIYGNVGQATAIVTVVCSQPVEAQKSQTQQAAQQLALSQRPAAETTTFLATGKNTMRIFPNPNAGQFSVQLPLLKVPQASIQIISENGQVVAQKTINLNVSGSKVDFNISNQAAGIYLVKLTSLEGTQVSKVVVVK